MVPFYIKNIKKSDVNIRPITVCKTYTLNSEELITNGFSNRYGLYSGKNTALGDAKALNDPINYDGSYQNVIWQSVNSMYYKNPYQPYNTFEHFDKYKTRKYIAPAISVISIPYLKSGDGIKPGSVRLMSNDYEEVLIDDSYGNLIVSGSIHSELSDINLIAYWGFNSLYTNGVWNGISAGLSSGSYSDDMTSYYKNCNIIPGKLYEGYSSGIAIKILNDGYVRTPNKDNLNLLSDTWEIHFKLNTFEIENGYIISKQGVRVIDKHGIKKITNGVSEKYRKYIYQEDEYIVTDVFPYSFKWLDNELIFERSVGKSKISINLSDLKGLTYDSSWIDISVVRLKVNNTHYIRLYLNGSMYTQVQDITEDLIYNQYDIVFGSLDTVSEFSKCVLDEVRFYNTYDSTINRPEIFPTDANIYGTAVVGNVFYKSGIIVLSSLYSYYSNYFYNINELTYNSSHTIYEYEILVRINKGEFNLTSNPSALRYYGSDSLSEEFITGELSPYVTTIGLYNDKSELVLIGKLGQPLKTRDDVDLNIMIKFDV